jgi:hypothetical protein
MKIEILGILQTEKIKINCREKPIPNLIWGKENFRLMITENLCKTKNRIRMITKKAKMTIKM